ncbi:MAG: AAA family ATPase [Anaerolineales bacterium]
MMNICANCGQYRPDKLIEPEGPYAVCPECGHRQRFRQLPLLIVSGASGAGKSTVCQQLTGALDSAVLLDSDILWRAEFNEPDDNYRGFFETWLRMAKNISQSGRPVVIFGAGMGMPENLEPCVERRYFSAVHYQALVCSEASLTQRLQSRPAWRGSGEAAFVDAQLSFNNWFKSRGAEVRPVIDLIDTTETSDQETTRQVRAWIERVIEASGGR